MVRGSFPGTYVVRKATRVPGAGTTGIGSRATSVAWATEATLTTMNSSMRPMAISIVTSSPTIHS